MLNENIEPIQNPLECVGTIPSIRYPKMDTQRSSHWHSRGQLLSICSIPYKFTLKICIILLIMITWSTIILQFSVQKQFNQFVIKCLSLFHKVYSISITIPNVLLLINSDQSIMLERYCQDPQEYPVFMFDIREIQKSRHIQNTNRE